MRHVAQRGDSDCGVATFAMLTDRSYDEALAVIGHEADVPDHTIRVWLQRDGWFIRDIDHRSESSGVWPPRPFAERHFAIVTQPSGNGHYVVMEADGTVLDPLTVEPRRLDEWEVCSNVCGMVRHVAAAEPQAQVIPMPRSDCHGFDPSEGGLLFCDCRCHVPIGPGAVEGRRSSCVHCQLIA